MPPDDPAAPAASDAAAAGDLLGTRWRKARCSGAENGGCVEVAQGLPGLIGIRDSHRPRDGAHFVPAAVFTAFLADAKAGFYDMKPE
jgi:hypothetical protein